MVDQSIVLRRGHLGVAEDARPFAEAKVAGNDAAGIS